METRSKKQKRKGLMVSSSCYVLPHQRPDLPARFESLIDDTLTIVLEFVGKKSYRSFGGVNKHCREIYLNTKGMMKETFLYGYGPLSVIKDRANERIERMEENDDFLLYPVGKGVVLYNRRDVLAWALQERKNDVLKGICFVAAREGRFDLLNEVWENVEDWDDKEEETIIFESVDFCAAIHGKLKVFKWLDGKGLKIDKYWCVKTAAYRGHLHIIQWLQEEQGLELHEESLYTQALYTGQLRVMKWLREQKVDWDRWTFKFVAQEGTLDILKWLHNEGYPWPDDGVNDVDDVDDRVHEDEIEPEALGWLRANGYVDRIRS